MFGNNNICIYLRIQKEKYFLRLTVQTVGYTDQKYIDLTMNFFYNPFQYYVYSWATK